MVQRYYNLSQESKEYLLFVYLKHSIVTFCKLNHYFFFPFANTLHLKSIISLQSVIGHKTEKILSLSSRQGEDTHLEDHGCSVNPKTRYAF